jgi:2-keto-4-pentenoate hydratase/2-oxohepta-3-ene-1,7-dioic acid hydratase in catechol pathway
MHIVRFRAGDETRYGVIEGSHIVEYTGTPYGTFKKARKKYPLKQSVLLAPVVPSKVVAVGRNYRDRAEELNLPVPSEPIIFLKPLSALCGPDDPIVFPPQATQVDYEAELAIVIKKRCRHVAHTRAREHVLGYTCLNDVSARDLQLGDGQWTRGKSLDTFCPMGPVLVTTDEIPDPQVLDIACRVHGRVMQQSNTAQMYFGVAEIVSHCSKAFTLEPGDVIATGTPGGVGIFRDPPILLEDGDEVSIEIERIGRLTNTCRHAPARVPVS